jgi:hypothetical protein
MKCEMSPITFNANYTHMVETIFEPNPEFANSAQLGNVLYRIREIRIWLDENSIQVGEHPDDYIWYFENVEDAMAFVLRWS